MSSLEEVQSLFLNQTDNNYWIHLANLQMLEYTAYWIGVPAFEHGF